MNTLTSEITTGQAIALPKLEKVAYTLKEFGALFGRTAAWAHRQKYKGAVSVVQGLGVDLVPRAEVERILAGTTNTPQKHAQGRKAKQND